MREKHKFLKKNMGFTLTELIVTMAVSALLLSAAAAGIVAWVRHADFVRNESYAETIYYAAQSELTRYRGNGQLAELAEYVKANEEGSEYRVPVESIDPTIAEKYKNRLYYLKKNAGSMEEDNPLGKWLSDYIYDGSIMEGAICVEFDPMDGTVYSVSYSDKNNSFTYEKEAEATADKEASLLARAENIRKEQCVGYYSVELSEAAPSAVKKTRLDRVRLVNEEQLYLRWSLPERYSSIRGFLSYTIEIYEEAQTAGEKDELRYTFTVKGSELQQKASGDSIQDILEVDGKNKLKYTVTCTDASEGEFDLIAYMDENGEMYLVLDSIDYGVNPADIIPSTDPATSPFNTDAFRNSASVLQLFAEPEDIYVKVQASGKSFGGSAKKQSNTSNTMFASMNETEYDCTYEIKNARHLYNIRYREKENEPVFSASPKKLYYQQTADVVWLSDDEKLFHTQLVEITNPDTSMPEMKMKMNPLQDADKCIPADETAAVPYFRAIPSLSALSTLEVQGSRVYELMNFVLYQKKPGEPAEEPTEGATEIGKLGLIAENRGTIRRLTITDITVQGYENVGAVCGVNKEYGTVWDTTVSGKVAGTENVGGIVGLDETNSVIAETDRTNLSETELENSQYKNLINYAEVTGGGGKIGGIAGTLGENGQAYLCKNYGAVKAAETCAVYIGGISGYNEGLVQSCLSAPDDAPARNEDGTLKQAALKGVFVGGVVGCNDGGVIKDSGTEKESISLAGGRSDSHIIGYRYVGGIVGYNNGTAVADDRTTEGTLINSDTGKTNKANVVGHDYVGGIVGANGTLKDADIINKNIGEIDSEKVETCEIEETYSDRILVQGWTNEGLVEAVGSYDSKNKYDADGYYAGGIAGYNAGDLLGCTTRINTSSSGADKLIAQVRLYGENASYVGGVTGYNVGYIHFDGGDGTLSVNSVVSGKKYVGGIVGYNGTAADGTGTENSGKIVNYALSGGNIFGEAYVGGYAGLNTTENLLGDGNTLSANPNEVKADYFAGGVMGALIVESKNTNEKITVKCATHNPFGTVTAENAFAGGYVGYTQLLYTGKDAGDRAEALYGKVTVPSIRNNIKSEDAAKRQEALQKLVETVLDEREESGLDNTARKFEFESGESSFASVKAPVFAGGVIGGNSWNTKLLLQNIYNRTRVKGTDSVTYDFISKAKNTKEGTEKQDRFAFAGGIIGLVTQEAEIDSCGNRNAGGVDGNGTYSGGIAEVNLGKIRNCTVNSVRVKSYYGGIAGLNTNEGEILSCRLDGQIWGESYLGGIVVCNESVIRDCTVSNSAENVSAVIGTGEYIGGIAAVNRVKMKTVGGTTPYPNEMEKCEVSSDIGAENLGEAVGGLIGRYEGGTLSKCDVWSGTIYGLDRVGGIIGEICSGLDVKEVVGIDGIIKNITNYSNVYAVNAAGGIGGYLKEGASVKRCTNTGEVRSMQEMAGGIVPEIKAGSTVSACTNSGTVEAMCSMAGGIAAINSGIIESCAMRSESAGKIAEIFGVDAIGGIAGENRGTVSGCSISGNVTVYDINASGKGRAIGGIVGRNTGTVSNSTAEGVSSGLVVTTRSNGSYLGGVAGENQGRIEGGALDIEVTLINPQQSFVGFAGGVAGANGGTINSVTFSGKVTGTSGGQYGTGGIAGRNELINKAGSISDCTLQGGIVTAVSGDTDFGGYKETLKGAYVGGICGVNPENGSIESCSLAGACKVYGDYGYVGGVVAYNYGTLKNSGSKTDVGASGIGKTDSGNTACVIGGITACNDTFGVLENCHTGAGWKIENARNTNASPNLFPTGGIIGCNKSVRDQKSLINDAAVNGNQITGGIIGQQFTALRGGFTIANCENHGSVSGVTNGVAGIIADWRYKGGHIRECINAGQVSGGSGTAGGILATGFASEQLSIMIERCGNEGDITGSYGSGGIMGSYNSSGSTLDLTITDCYNAAVIQNTNSTVVSAGIYACSHAGGHLKLTIIRCVNYGRGSDSERNFAGIASKGSDSIVNIQHCLNVGECFATQVPMVAGYQVTAENYYFQDHQDTAGRTATKVAERQSGGAFNAITGSTEFDEENERLKLGNGRYLQFTNVSYVYQDGGDNAAIRGLKEAFSAPDYRKKNKGINDRYALLVFGMDSGTFAAPSRVGLEETGNVYKVTYEGHPNAIFCTAGYELEILGHVKDSSAWETLTKTEITNPGQNTWTIAGDTLFDVKDREQYTELKVRVRAVKAGGYDGITPSISDWTESASIDARPKLPTPQIHFEVTNENHNNLTGYWVLSNAQDYKDCGENWEIVIENAGNVGNISPFKLRSKEENASYGGDRNFTVNAYAKPTGENNAYGQSDTFIGTVFARTKDNTIKAEPADDSKGKFTGTRAGDFSYRFRVKQSGVTRTTTHMAEFWFDGKKIEENTVLLPYGDGGEECAIDLSSLDQETLRELMKNIADPAGKKVEVRFYPWEIDGFKYYITSYNAENGTTTITSRTIPEAYKTNASAFNKSYQIFPLNGMEGYEMYPTPKAGGEVIPETKDDGTIIYTLYWDADAAADGTITPFVGDDYEGAEYAVTVTGKTGNTEVPLYQGTVTVDENTPPKVSLTENNWKYTELVLSVERLGKEAVSADGKHYIGASTEKTYKIPIRLSSVSILKAELRDRDTLVFLVDWVESPDSGVSGYRIIMTGKDANGNPIKTVTHNVAGKDVVNAEIDLEDAKYADLSGAKEIEFSIVVLSDEKDTAHLDSREGEKVQREISERLPVPSAATTTLKYSDEPAATALTPEKFAELKLHLENAGALWEDAGYQIEYFVAGKDAQKLGGLPANWNKNGGERPEQDSKKGIYISKEPVRMEGSDLKSADYVLNQPGNPFNAERAGRILWYRVREISQSKISSAWTTWEKIELPKALLAPVKIAEGQTADRECAYTLNEEAKEEYVVTMRQPKLDFAPVPFAKGYAIDIKEADSTEEKIDENDGSVEEIIKPGAVHRYTLERKISPEGELLEEPLVLKDGDTEIEVESEETSATGETIRTFKPLYTMDYSFEIQRGNNTYVYTFPTSARICYSVKNNTIQEIWLELPDGVALAEDGTSVRDSSFKGTAAADITVIPPDERYVVEKLTRWQRDEEDPEKITITEVEKGSASIAVMGYFEDELNTKQLSERALQLFGLSRPPEKLPPEKVLPEEETQEAEPPEEELPEEEMQEAEPLKEEPPEEADKEEEDSEKSEALGNNVPDSDAEQ